MTAAALLSKVQLYGGRLLLDGAGVTVEAPRPLPDALLSELRVHKAELRRHLEALNEDFEERAAILEYDAGLERLEAEQEAARLVYCRDCQHFTSDPINPKAGIGCCDAGWDVHGSHGPYGSAPPPFPMAPRYCRAWRKQ